MTITPIITIMSSISISFVALPWLLGLVVPMTSKYDVNGGEGLPQPPYSAKASSNHIITLPLMRQDIVHGVWVPKKFIFT
jgi:hypothetical protein